VVRLGLARRRTSSNPFFRYHLTCTDRLRRHRGSSWHSISRSFLEVSKDLSASRVVTTAEILTELLNCIEADDHRDLQF